MLAAHALWEATPPGTEATAETWTSAYERIVAETGDELRAIWSGISTGQRRILAALAVGERLYGSRRTQGGSRGGATKAAIGGLLDRGEIVETNDGYGLVDPLVATWIRSR